MIHHEVDCSSSAFTAPLPLCPSTVSILLCFCLSHTLLHRLVTIKSLLLNLLFRQLFPCPCLFPYLFICTVLHSSSVCCLFVAHSLHSSVFPFAVSLFFTSRHLQMHLKNRKRNVDASYKHCLCIFLVIYADSVLKKKLTKNSCERSTCSLHFFF